MPAYYNENDPKAAAWLRELIAHGHIAPGHVDDRSIEDVTPNDVRGYTQCHFFAGIGGWSYALRLAGWPDDRPVWTGSCPCQPFSQAGKGLGLLDERHVWPAWDWLVGNCFPPVVFGEQVASPAGLDWFDLVRSDLESAGYAVGGADLCAASVGAPHIRQRLYWVAHHHHLGRQQHPQRNGESERWLETGPHGDDAGRCSVMGHAGGEGGRRDTGKILGAEGSAERGMRSQPDQLESSGAIDWLALPDGRDTGSEGLQRSGQHGQQPEDGSTSDGLGHAGGERLEGRRMPAGGREDERSAWTPSNLVWCRDGKWRPVEPGSFPLAHGIPGRVGLLRGYGNAIVPQVAAAFVEAYRSVA